MSTVLLGQVWPLQLPPVAKSVLVSLADNANDSGFCWPSIETICERTCYGRTSVIEAIKWLDANGYLVPNRSNGRKTTYQLTPEAGGVKPSKPVRLVHPSATRTGPADGLNQSATRTKPVRQPDTNHQEPSITVIKANTGASAECPEGIDPDAWALWDSYRTSKSKKSWTDEAKKLTARTLRKISAGGGSQLAAVEQSIERGWTGLFAVKTETTNATGGNHGKQSLVERVAANLKADLESGALEPVLDADDFDLRPRMGVDVRG